MLWKHALCTPGLFRRLAEGVREGVCPTLCVYSLRLTVYTLRKCEICNVGFVFSSLYAPEAPPHLPPSVLLRALWKKAAKRAYKTFRWGVFLTAWLVLAPLGTLWLSKALFQSLHVTFAQIRGVLWALADGALVQGPFVLKAALEALFSGSAEPLSRFFFLDSPLPRPGQSVWDSLNSIMYVFILHWS